ncbi:MAG TPA: BlaI/MecI/CopY family transcriptional regulator [Candidatus Acidoferrales bacterium]|nr:BlaI/MecI/CopY family transcriptional regulator [Candidatus Acidoferrales bacterium]
MLEGCVAGGSIKLNAMFRFWKTRSFSRRESPAPASLGPLEENVMEILWARGESSVREVIQKLERPLAYTTVMTTLDRLFKKGLLTRHKSDRAFVYSPRFSRSEYDRARANSLVAGFLYGPGSGRELLLSSFLDAVGQHDREFLADLEKKIRGERKKLLRRSPR